MKFTISSSSNDMIDEKFIETLYNLCKENNCDISECNLQRFEKEVVKKADNYDKKITRIKSKIKKNDK